MSEEAMERASAGEAVGEIAGVERNRVPLTHSKDVIEALTGKTPGQPLATPTAERIVRKYFDGEPWVGTETPVGSIDDRVT